MADEQDRAVAAGDLPKKRKHESTVSKKKTRKEEEVILEVTTITHHYNDLSTQEKLKCIEYCIRNL